MTIDTSREAVERLLDGVTPGPWGCSTGKLVRIVKVVGRSPIVLAGVHRFGRNGGKATDGDCEANARFIAASRELVPALLARAEAAEAERDRAMQACEQIASRLDAALAEVARLSTPPDALALVAAAYRDAVRNILGVTILVAPDGISHREGAESVRRQLAGFIETLTPADAESHLTALLRAEYERGKAETQTDAARDVLAERARQVSAEGWTREHDDLYVDGEMAAAAACYAITGGKWQSKAGVLLSMLWPWARSWFKSTGHRRDLVKAGALILAEIERLDRLALLTQEGR
jgi:hypothetical protein